jgi:hypothetical protein
MADKTLSVSLSAVKAGLNESLEDLESTLEDINDQLALMSFSAASASASLKSLNAETSKLNQRLGGTNKEGSNLAEIANAITNISDEGTDSIRNLGKALNKTTGNMEETSDSSKKTSGVLGVLNTVFEGTTVNIGAFNLQLKNLIVTLPIVTGLIGSVTVAMGSLFTVIAGIAGLLGAGLAAGFAQDLQDIEENSAEVTDTFEAMEEKMSRIRDAIVEATEPLQIQAFQTLADQVGGGLLWALNQFSIQMAESVDLIFALKDAMADPFVSNFNRTLDVLTNSVERMLPVIRGVSEYLAKAIPEFMRFSSVQTMRFAEEIGSLIKAFIQFGKEATKLTITIIKALAPVIELALNILEGILQVINSIPESLKDFALKAIVLAVAIEKLVDWLSDSEGLLSGILEITGNLEDEQSNLTKAFEDGIPVISSYNEKLQDVKDTYVKLKTAQAMDREELAEGNLARHLSSDKGIGSSLPENTDESRLAEMMVGGYLSNKARKQIFKRAGGGILSPGASSTAGGSGLLSRIPKLSGSMSSLSSKAGSLTGILSSTAVAAGALAAGLALFIDVGDGTLDIISELKQQFDVVTDILSIVWKAIKFVLIEGLSKVLYVVNLLGKGIMFLSKAFRRSYFGRKILQIANLVSKATDEVDKALDRGLDNADTAIQGEEEEVATQWNRLTSGISGVMPSDGTSTDGAQSDTSAESMRRGDTYVDQEYNVENNVNQNVQDPNLTSKQKRVLNDMMRQFRQEAQNEAIGG